MLQQCCTGLHHWITLTGHLGSAKMEYLRLSHWPSDLASALLLFFAFHSKLVKEQVKLPENGSTGIKYHALKMLTNHRH